MARIWVSGARLVLPCLALLFFCWVTLARIERANRLSLLPGRMETAGQLFPQSATGYGNDQRELILPDRSEDSFHWIVQTQQMFANKEWRVRWVDYDNAPLGRAVNSASPYRWWLGLVAWGDHLFSGRPIGLSVERAALFADPILQGLLLVLFTGMVAWQFGSNAGAIVALGLAVTFPLAAGFYPGLPDSRGLAVACAMAGVLALAAGVRIAFRSGITAAAAQSQSRNWFLVAGVLGGLGLWVDVSIGTPVLLGICAGALLAAFVALSAASAESVPIPPWRCWAFGGAATVLVAYAMEYFPAHAGSWRLESVHPLYGLAWLGLGEVVFQLSQRIQRRRWTWSAAEMVLLALALLAIAAFPVVASKTESTSFLVRNLNASQLARLPESAAASGLSAWLTRDGVDLATVATLAPLLTVGSAAWLIFRKTTAGDERMALALVMGPVLLAIGFAWQQLSWWSVVDALVVVLLVVVSASCPAKESRRKIWFWLVPSAAWIVASLILFWPRRADSDAPVMTGAEAQLLIERDVAHWLARRSHFDRSVVYAPPNETTTLSFYGGLRGIGTYCLDNDAAVQATLKIATAGSMQEAKLLLQGRSVRYLVLPSWDSFFEDYARFFPNKNESAWNEFFVASLKRWRLPPWLRPLPYETPEIGGLGQQAVQIFEIVDDQKPAVAAGRLVECLLTVGDNERAAAAVSELKKFPADVGALAAEAQVMVARNDHAGFERAMESLQLRLKGGADRYLPWDRRVSVAIVLARARQPELARAQVQQCAAAFDEEKAGSLSTGSLYNLLGLARAFGVQIPNASAREWSLKLLPPEMRTKLE